MMLPGQHTPQHACVCARTLTHTDTHTQSLGFVHSLVYVFLRIPTSSACSWQPQNFESPTLLVPRPHCPCMYQLEKTRRVSGPTCACPATQLSPVSHVSTDWSLDFIRLHQFKIHQTHSFSSPLSTCVVAKFLPSLQCSGLLILPLPLIFHF